MLIVPTEYARRFTVLIDDGAGELLVGPRATPAVMGELRQRLGDGFVLRRIGQDEFNSRFDQRREADRDTSTAVMADIDDNLDLQALSEAVQERDDLLDSADQAPVVRLLNAIIAEAANERASDVHIECYADAARVRLRIDGVLRNLLELRPALAPLLISRLKIMARLDIAEKRLPQDGRMSVRIGQRNIDLRVSTIPSTHGERVVMRLLEKNAEHLSLDQIGMSAVLQSRLTELVHRPHGIVLVTGPTGSGKTTTLYAALQQLDARERNIMTVEDPVEYDLRGVSQTQINTRTGMSFAKGLRSILRQDPDVILVGEIRDGETAEIAVQASLTGHLVLSTLHTNTALGAITRLQDLGVDQFLVSSTLTAVLAQRLVRRLCTHCREAVPADSYLQQHASLEGVATIYAARGCEHCNHTGYSGRLGIYELVETDAELRAMIHDGSGEQQMERHIRQRVPTLRDSGFELVAAGETTVEEVLRVTTL